MSAAALPLLSLADFGPGLDHEVNTFVGSKVVSITHRLDPSLPVLPALIFAPSDPYTYVFVHGGMQHNRFENLDPPTHEIPVDVVVALLVNQYGSSLAGMKLRLCSCYGNLVRPGETMTLAQRFAIGLPSAAIEAYHGVVYLVAGPPAIMQFGVSVEWDATLIPPGTLVIGPPGNWEPI